MKIKRFLCLLLAVNMLLSGMTAVASAAKLNKLAEQNFNAAEEAQLSSLSMIEGYNWTGEKTATALAAGKFGRGQKDKSLEFTATGYETESRSAGLTAITPSGAEYTADDSYLFQMSVYVPKMTDEVVSVCAGLTYVTGGTATEQKREQFLHTSGQIRNTKDTASTVEFLQDGWNLISLHLNRDATDFRYRLYVNGYCNYYNEHLYVDEGTSFKDIFIRLSFADREDNAKREISGSLLIDDVMLVKGVSAGDVFTITTSADIKSDTYTVTDTAVTRVPDNATVGAVIGNITGNSVYAVKMEQNGDTVVLDDDEPIKNATNIVSVNELGAIKMRSIELAKTVNGYVIPEEDFEEGDYDTIAWETDSGIASAVDNSTLFEVASGNVTVGKGTSPRTVGGFWHIACEENIPQEDLNFTIKKKSIDGNAFYHFQSTAPGTILSVRGQGANLDEEKMTRGRYSIVEFAYRAEELSHFNVTFRYKVNGEVKRSDDLFGTYETESITFAPDGKIYLGGWKDKLDPNSAALLGEYKTDTTYNVALVMSFPNDSTLRVEKVLINGEAAAEGIERKSAFAGITQLCEVDLYMKPSDDNTCYNHMVSGARCYTADGYVNFSGTEQKNSMIKLGENSYALLDGAATAAGAEFYLLSNRFTAREKVDSFAERNHEALAKAEFDIDDRYNIAYKLNDESESGSAVSVIGGVFADALVEHSWLCDSCKNPGGVSVSAKIGLLSAAEADKYAGLIGTADKKDGFWWLRSGSRYSENDVVCVSNSNPKMLVNRKAHGTMYVRPSFYINESFFKTQKLDYIGSQAARILDSFFTRADIEALYTEEEINSYFVRPTVRITEIDGKTVVGEKLSAKYEWLSDYDENASVYRWYIADTKDGAYSPIACSDKELLLTEDMAGKYIKAAVIPKNNSRINPVGAEVISDFSTNVIYNDEMLEDMMSVLNAEAADTLYGKLAEYNDFNNLDLSLEPDEILPVMTILSKMDLTAGNLKAMYNAAVALTELNAAELNEIEDILKSDGLMLDLTCYNRLDAQKREAVRSSLYNKGFDDYSEFVKAFVTQVAVLEFDGAGREQLYSLLKDYSAYFTTKLDGFSDYQLRQVAARIENSYASFEQIDNAVTAAAKQVSEADDDDDSDSTPSRGGGGGGGGSSAVAVVPVQNELQQQYTSRYNDLDSVPWAASIIEELSDIGVLSGNGDGGFNPNGNLKREEFATMLVRAFGLEGESDIEFYDVDNNAWYAPYVKKAVANGVISGYGNGYFGVGDEITREDMFVMIYRVIKEKLPEIGSWYAISDISDAYDYAKEPLIIMMKAEIVSGDENGKVDPKGKATRAMAARVLYLAMKKNGNI